MRVKIKKHVSFRGVYDTHEIIEASSITKSIQHDKCWLNVDDRGFEMEEIQADNMIDEVFRYGTLDLSEYEETSIPW